MSIHHKIILVEDDPELRLMYEELLGSDGYTVQGIADGLTALELLSNKVDAALILLDIMLPHVTGIDILTTVKSPANPNHKIPIVMFSNIKNDEVQKKTQELGSVGFILKADENPEELLSLIKKYLPPPTKNSK